jgi:lysozyme
MINSQNQELRQFIIKHEGYRRKPYLCPAGKNTIGVGWNMDANPLPRDIKAYLDDHGEITDTMVYRLLDLSLDTAIENCLKLYNHFKEFPEKIQMCLVDLMFNMGLGKMKKFVNTNRFIEDKDWKLAANGLKNSLWYKQVGVRAREIVKIIAEMEG